MKVIKKKEGIEGKNSDECKTIEYSFDDKDLDLGIAIITGRFPKEGYAKNLISKELIYVLEGSGEIVFENDAVKFEEGDAILIYPEEKYYWQSDFCKVSMFCNPAWDPKQHIID